jgi:hypothetical protein
MPVGRELVDAREALRALVERNPRHRRRALADRTAAVFDDADRLLDGLDELVSPYDGEPTPGERAGGASRPGHRDRDRRTPGQRAGGHARSLARDTREAGARLRDGDRTTPGTRGALDAGSLIEDARAAAAGRRRKWGG